MLQLIWIVEFAWDQGVQTDCLLLPMHWKRQLRLDGNLCLWNDLESIDSV